MAPYAGIPRAIDKITTLIKHFRILGIQAGAVYPEAVIQLPSVNQVPIYDIRNYNSIGQVTNNNSAVAHPRVAIQPPPANWVLTYNAHNHNGAGLASVNENFCPSLPPPKLASVLFIVVLLTTHWY